MLTFIKKNYDVIVTLYTISGSVYTVIFIWKGTRSDANVFYIRNTPACCIQRTDLVYIGVVEMKIQQCWRWIYWYTEAFTQLTSPYTTNFHFPLFWFAIVQFARVRHLLGGNNVFLALACFYIVHLLHSCIFTHTVRIRWVRWSAWSWWTQWFYQFGFINWGFFNVNIFNFIVSMQKVIANSVC